MKIRTAIPSEASADALFEANHTCCRCRTAGKSVQIHHIDDDPVNNDRLNMAVLCLQCHDETQTYGGFGRHLSAAEVRRYRDDWTARVKKRRDDADQLAAAGMASGTHAPTVAGRSDDRPPTIPNRSGLQDYIRILPELRRRAYRRMLERNPVSTLDIVEALSDLGAVLQQVLVALLGYYPEEHFAERGPQHYVGTLVAQSTHWHYMRASSYGIDESGSVVHTLTEEGLVRDLERWIGEVVSSLCGTDVGRPSEQERAWQQAWRETITGAQDGA